MALRRTSSILRSRTSKQVSLFKFSGISAGGFATYHFLLSKAACMEGEKDSTMEKLSKSGEEAIGAASAALAGGLEAGKEALIAASGSGEEGDNKGEKAITALAEKVYSVLAPLGFGGVMGVCSGIAFKRVSKQAAINVGIGFAILQVLSAFGYIDINFNKVQSDIKQKLDGFGDGDGKFDFTDVKLIIKKLLTFFGNGLPSAGGFASGLALGIYYG